MSPNCLVFCLSKARESTGECREMLLADEEDNSSHDKDILGPEHLGELD